jgi:hypothetical protein
MPKMPETKELSRRTNSGQGTVFYLDNNAKGKATLQRLRENLNRQFYSLRVRNRGEHTAYQNDTPAERTTHFAVYLDRKHTPEQLEKMRQQSAQQFTNDRDANYHRTYCAIQKQELREKAAQLQNDLLFTQQTLRDVDHELQKQRKQTATIRADVFRLSLFAIVREWLRYRFASTNADNQKE